MRLADIEPALPDRTVDIESYRQRFENFDLAVMRSGVTRKHVASDEETALDIAVRAFEKLEARAPGTLESIDGVIFVTQTPDYLFPGNSFLLIDRLALKQNIVNYDINQGCAGFVYGANLAKAMMAADQAETIAVVCSDTYSKLISPRDRGTSLLFGDGGAVSIFSKHRGAFQLRGLAVRQLARYADLFMVRDGAARDLYRSREPVIEMQGAALLEVLATHAPDFVRGILDEHDVDMEDVDLVVCHQASRIALERLGNVLKVPPAAMFCNLDRLGNTTSASIPIALADGLFGADAGGSRRVLVFGFGVGFSMGAMILERL